MEFAAANAAGAGGMGYPGYGYVWTQRNTFQHSFCTFAYVVGGKISKTIVTVLNFVLQVGRRLFRPWWGIFGFISRYVFHCAHYRSFTFDYGYKDGSDFHIIPIFDSKPISLFRFPVRAWVESKA
jgi:hypothetical protein